MVLGQLTPKEITPNPKANSNPNLNPHPNWGTIFLGGDCPYTTFLESFLLTLNTIFPLKFPLFPLLHGSIYSTFMILLSKRIARKTNNTAQKVNFLIAK